MNKHVKSTTIIVFLGLCIIILALVFVFVIKNNNRNSLVSEESSDTPSLVDNQPISQLSIAANQSIALPMTITGAVAGGWFFEGSFPVYIKDDQGTQLGIALATTPEDWMTSNPLPFSVVLPMVNYQGPGMIVFTKDNPSGESQFDASFTLPIMIQ